MITLTKARKKPVDNNGHKRISIRDKLLVKEVQEMSSEDNMPSTIKTVFQDPNNLAEFFIIISPNEGLWRGGNFKFLISIPEDYNMLPPKVKCMTKILHPNISTSGDVCLSLLRLNSIDGMGWLPTRRLKDVAFGINSLFTDLCDFDDPLNIELSEEYSKNSEKCKQRIREHVIANCREKPL